MRLSKDEKWLNELFNKEEQLELQGLYGLISSGCYLGQLVKPLPPIDIMDFYFLNCKDNEGRLLSDLWKLSDEELEQCHSHIQLLFPLPEPSNYCPDAPILTQENMDWFKKSPLLQEYMLKSFRRMLDFYGFEIAKSNSSFGQKIIKSVDFEKKSQNWLTLFNHNYLRITRILACLALCGLKEWAFEFYGCLLDMVQDKEIFEVVGIETVMYWNCARDGLLIKTGKKNTSKNGKIIREE